MVALAVTSLVTGCGGQFPADPDGTLDRVEGGHLRVGVSANPPWTQVPAGPEGTAPPGGLEPRLVEEFAASLGAEVVWEVGGEEALVADLEAGRLDVVVGGLTAASPWAARAALTYPYVTVPGPDGRDEAHVMATPMGENAFLVRLERFLLDQDVRPADVGAGEPARAAPPAAGGQVAS